MTEDFRDCSPACFNGAQKQLQVWGWQASSWGWLSTKVLIQIKSKTNVVILHTACIPRSSIFLVKDTQEHKVQKILTWSDFGPYKSLDEKALQSIAKSISSLEVGSIFFLIFKRLFLKFTFLASLHRDTNTNDGDGEWHHDHHKISQGYYCQAQGHLWASVNSWEV